MTVARRIRILYPPRPRPSFGQRLEERARTLSEQVSAADRLEEPVAIVRQQIALTLDQLDGVRRVHGAVSDQISERRRELGAKITSLTPSQPQYGDPDRPTRYRLTVRLLQLEAEQRQRTEDLTGRLQGLQSRLLELVQRHGQLRW